MRDEVQRGSVATPMHRAVAARRLIPSVASDRCSLNACRYAGRCRSSSYADASPTGTPRRPQTGCPAAARGSAARRERHSFCDAITSRAQRRAAAVASSAAKKMAARGAVRRCAVSMLRVKMPPAPRAARSTLRSGCAAHKSAIKPRTSRHQHMRVSEEERRAAVRRTASASRRADAGTRMLRGLCRREPQMFCQRAEKRQHPSRRRRRY